MVLNEALLNSKYRQLHYSDKLNATLQLCWPKPNTRVLLAQVLVQKRLNRKAATIQLMEFISTDKRGEGRRREGKRCIETNGDLTPREKSMFV